MRLEKQIKSAEIVVLLFAYAEMIANFTYQAFNWSLIVQEKTSSLDAYDWIEWAQTASFVPGNSSILCFSSMDGLQKSIMNR